MATTKLAAPTVAAIGVTIGTLVAPLLSPLVAAAERISAGITDLLAGQAVHARQIAEIKAQLAAAPAPDTPPVTTPDLGLPAPASGCIVTLISVDGAIWRWDATAAARQDSLGLRAVVDVPIEIVGASSLRLVADLGPSWAVIVPRNSGTNRVAGGAARYSMQVHLDGELVLDERDIAQTQYRGTRPYRLGQMPAWPLPSTDELIARGLVARYAQGPVAEQRLADWAKAMAAADWQKPWSSRGITQYMPGTGGRDDIGPTTAAQAAYLACRDPRALAYAFGQAEAGTTIPWEMWDAAAKTWVTPRRWPRLWTDGRGGEPGKGTLLQPLDGGDWTPEIAHQPDLFYVPYLLTGERWLLDNLQAQAAWCVLVQWPAMRGDTDDNVVSGNQVRGGAWGLRQIDDAAWASPEGSAERVYFEEVSRNNWRWVRAQIPVWTEQQGEVAGWIPGAYGIAGALGPWQQDYFASAALAAARRGNVDALEVLRWQRNWLVGRFKFLGHDGCAYLLAAYDPNTGADYRTWAEIKSATVALDWSNGDGWQHSNGDYARLARWTLAGLADVLDDAEAAEWARWLVQQGAPYTTAADDLREPMLRVEVGW